MNTIDKTETINQLLLRNLSDVFGEGDGARRLAAIKEVFTEDCVVCLPFGRFIGHDALHQVAGELRAGHPSYAYTPLSAASVVQDGGLIMWGSGSPGEPPKYTGGDFITVRGARIATLYVFLHSPPG